MKRLLIALLVALIPAQGFGQASVVQGGSYTAGILPMYSASGSPSQPTVQQSGTAAGGAQSIKELSIVARGSGTAPYTGSGGGYLGSQQCIYDGPTTGAYRQLCIGTNVTGGFGLLSYNAFNGASSQDLKFIVNGTTYAFPFTQGSVSGPGSSTVGHIATWANTSGTLLADGGAALTVGGTNRQIQVNNAGVLGGVTMSGDATFNGADGNISITKIGGQSVNLGGGFHTDGFVGINNFPVTLNATASTTLTLPITGTLATLAGSEALTNKTVNGLTITSSTGTLTVTDAKVFRTNNTLTFAGTDGSTLNVGTGGTLGTAAYTASSAYMPSGVQKTGSLGSDTALSNTTVYFTGPSLSTGGTGTWYCTGTVTVADTAGAATFYAKLWDGTTTVATASADSVGANKNAAISVSGYLASPASTVRISVKDTTATTGVIKFNATGDSKSSTLSCFRVE